MEGRNSKHKSAPAPTTRDTLQLAEKAIKLCPNPQDLTVVLHDHIPFISFLKSLWKPDSVSPHLRTLRMDMTLAKILKPLIGPKAVLPNLEFFSVDLAPVDLKPSLTMLRKRQATRTARLSPSDPFSCCSGTP